MNIITTLLQQKLNLSEQEQLSSNESPSASSKEAPSGSLSSNEVLHSPDQPLSYSALTMLTARNNCLGNIRRLLVRHSQCLQYPGS